MARLTESQIEAFETLRRAYLAEVPARIAAVREAATAAGRPGAPPGALEDLRHLVHQLVGSSAVFGERALCEAARALEDLVAALLVDGARAGGELGRLTRALERAWKQGATSGSRESKAPPKGMGPGASRRPR
jgi:HPt (histidine-containing phosphotransfer) domain-containing protein